MGYREMAWGAVVFRMVPGGIPPRKPRDLEASHVGTPGPPRHVADLAGCRGKPCDATQDLEGCFGRSLMESPMGYTAGCHGIPSRGIPRLPMWELATSTTYRRHPRWDLAGYCGIQWDPSWGLAGCRGVPREYMRVFRGNPPWETIRFRGMPWGCPHGIPKLVL